MGSLFGWITTTVTTNEKINCVKCKSLKHIQHSPDCRSTGIWEERGEKEIVEGELWKGAFSSEYSLLLNQFWREGIRRIIIITSIESLNFCCSQMRSFYRTLFISRPHNFPHQYYFCKYLNIEHKHTPTHTHALSHSHKHIGLQFTWYFIMFFCFNFLQ